MLINYKLVKTEDLEATEQLCVDLNKALEQCLDIMGKAMKQIDDQRELIRKQQSTIDELNRHIKELESDARAYNYFMDKIAKDPIDFPNSKKGGF